MSTEELRLRQAAKSDRGLIWQMIRSENLNPLGVDWRRFILAVSENGEIAGCAQVKPHRDGTRELASLVVLPAWRGKRVAHKLIHALQAQSGPPLYLTCRSGLVGFYEQFGFYELKRHELTGYYRLAKRLVTALVSLTRSREGLAVMRWDGPV